MPQFSIKQQLAEALAGEDDTLIHALKYKVYLLALFMGVVTLSIIWAMEIVQSRVSSFEYVLHPFMIVLFTALGILLLRSSSYLRLFEVISYVWVFIYFLSQFMVTLNEQELGNVDQRLSSFLQWIPAIYVLAFLIFNTRYALMSSLLFWGLLWIPSLIYWASAGEAGMAIGDIFFLIQMYLASAIYIVLLLIVSLLKEQYVRAQVAADTMKQLANMDVLTQTYNRRYLEVTLNRVVDYAKRYGRNVSVIIFDLDHFKQVNDTFGHPTGDQVLRDVAEIVRQCIRLSDEFGRWGGEEFLVVAVETEVEQAQRLAERLRSALAKYRFNEVGTVTASFGVAMRQKDETADQLVMRADQLLYLAKANGRNRVEVARLNPFLTPLAS